jgi:transposase
MMQGMKPYSEDLRKSIVRAVEDGMPKFVAARLFGVSLSSVKRYARIAQRGASLAPRTNSLKRTSRNVRPLLWQKGVAS